MKLHGGDLIHWIGRGLTLLGRISLPLVLGGTLGFYAADQGMPWLPTGLSLLLGGLLVGLLVLPLGRLLQGTAFRETSEGRRVRLRVVVLSSLVVVVALLRLGLWWLQEPSPLTTLGPEQFHRTFQEDSRRYRELEQGLERTVAYLGSLDGLTGEEVPSPELERSLLMAWRSLQDSAFALDQIRIFYEDWYRFDPSRAGRSRFLRSYLLTFAAELALFRHSGQAVELLRENPAVQRFLDAPHPELGLPDGSLGLMQRELQGSRDLTRVAAGKAYLRAIEVGLSARVEAHELGCGWLWEQIEADLLALAPRLEGGAEFRALDADLELLRQELRHGWYPAQSAVARWMGDTRFQRVGTYLVTPEQARELARELRPGDILLARKNWYLSNVGLPGFWPHAILYLGSPEELSAELDGPEQTLTEHLARAAPQAWSRYSAGTRGGPFRVIEAVSDGVIFNSLDHVTGDYVVALRPRLDRQARAQAVVEAFRHWGKPYDYNFDFATDHALVCTELVWRSYRPGEGKEGLEIPLSEIMGRPTLPANQIAALYADERDQPESQLDFVAYWDASEAEGRAFRSTEEEFARSHLRTKWDLSLP